MDRTRRQPGNLKGNDRVSLILVDYPHRARLKLFGRARWVRAEDDPTLLAELGDPRYEATAEHAVVIEVEGFDWNRPQHITPRFTEAEVKEAVAPPYARIAELEAALAASPAGAVPPSGPTPEAPLAAAYCPVP